MFLKRLDRLDVAIGLTIVVLLVIIVGLVLGSRLREPRLTYLASSDGVVQNVYVVDVQNPGSARQITHSDNGVVGYGMTADGSHLFYSEISFTAGQRLGVTSFYEQDVSSGVATLVYTCSHAACTDLAVRPDGTMLAFQQIDLNGVAGIGQGAPRIWLLDTTNDTARPLFTDNQRLGENPRWSPDGSKLALYSPSAGKGGIVIRDFTTGQDTLLQNTDGNLGTFSPNGRWLFYRRIVLLDSAHAVLHTVVIDLGAQPALARSLEADSDPVSDVEAIWQVDSASLLIARQAQPENHAQDRSEGFSLYRVDIQSGTASDLLPADGNTQTSLSLSPTGNYIALQRVAQSSTLSAADTFQAAHPELWVYSLGTGKLTLIGQDLSSPGWLS